MAKKLRNLNDQGIALILSLLVLVPSFCSLSLELGSAAPDSIEFWQNGTEWLKGFLQNFSTEMLA